MIIESLFFLKYKFRKKNLTDLTNLTNSKYINFVY